MVHNSASFDPFRNSWAKRSSADYLQTLWANIMPAYWKANHFIKFPIWLSVLQIYKEPREFTFSISLQNTKRASAQHSHRQHKVVTLVIFMDFKEEGMKVFPLWANLCLPAAVTAQQIHAWPSHWKQFSYSLRCLLYLRVFLKHMIFLFIVMLVQHFTFLPPLQI